MYFFSFIFCKDKLIFEIRVYFSFEVKKIENM